jgi:hypothetical protein
LTAAGHAFACALSFITPDGNHGTAFAMYVGSSSFSYPMSCTAVTASPIALCVQALKQRTEIQVLFLKALQSQNPAVHGAAMAALKAYIKVDKIPKQLLQETLREMLQALGNHRTLSLPLLNGMHRLLEVLSDWFNLSLGDKLIDHLAHWMDLDTLFKERVKGWAEGEARRGRGQLTQVGTCILT